MDEGVSQNRLIWYDEMSSKFNVEYIAGGATQNSIKVAQWMLQIPGATSYMESIGKDKYGEAMKKDATTAGVNVHYYEDESAPTWCLCCWWRKVAYRESFSCKLLQVMHLLEDSCHSW